jgi:hypothetical protein
MKRILCALTMGSLLAAGISGCSDPNKATIKQETKIETPKGSTTITTEKEVKKTGDAPPP